MMKLLCSFVLLLVMVLSLVGCDSVDTVYVVPSNNDPYSLENRELRIGVDLDSSIVLVAASVDVLDDSLKKIRSVESRAIGGFRQWYKKDGWSFEVAEQNYESSYLKVSYTCVLPNGDSATFVDYVDIAWEMYPTFYLIQSLRKYRIESLVKKEKFPLYTAIRIANRDLLEFFSFSSALDIESQEKHLAWIKEYPYLYGGYYLSDPDFPDNVEAIAKDFDRVLTKNKKVSALDTVEMVDNALFSGQMDILFRDSHYWTAYGFPYCDSTRRDSVVFNNVKGSYYKDSLFKCDGRAWRKIGPRSSSSSVMSSSSANPLDWCLKESRILAAENKTYSIAYDSLCSSEVVNQIDSVNFSGGFYADRVMDLSSAEFLMNLVDSATWHSLAYWYRMHPVLSWNEDEVLCPDGFHIPDTLEFKNSQWLFDNNQLGAFETKAIGDTIPSAIEAFAFFWTSNAKSGNIRYCAQLNFYDTPLFVGQYSAKRAVKPYFVEIVECPVDVTMAIQLACAKALEKR